VDYVVVGWLRYSGIVVALLLLYPVVCLLIVRIVLQVVVTFVVHCSVTDLYVVLRMVFGHVAVVLRYCCCIDCWLVLLPFPC